MRKFMLVYRVVIVGGGVAVTTGYQLAYLCGFLKDRNVFVVGDKRLYEEIYYFLEYFEIHLQGFLDDLYEILYQENYFILITGDAYKPYIDRLCEIGLHIVDDFMPFGCIGDNLFPLRKCILDTNLGYTVVNDGRHIGCVMHEAKMQERYKIAVLGGSTTDGTLYSFRSWPEILHGLLDEDTVTIINYGMAGYNSGMELMKLIRDVICSMPDLVLVFDGVNDFASVEYDAGNPISFKYLNSVIGYIADQTNREMYGGAVFENLTPYDRWIGNVDMMNAVLRLHNIIFIDFLQPMLAAKKNKTRKEELLECMVEADLSEARSFRDCYEAEKKREYIIDLSGIFDDYEDIYMDYAHVNEKGNQIIAAQIYDYLKSRLAESEEGCQIWKE